MRWKSLILGMLCVIAPMPPALAQVADAPKTDAAPAKLAAPLKPVKARPALWVVKDADTTIYLFGTIHLLQPNLRWFDGPVRKAFDRSQQVVLEIANEDKAAAQADLLQRALQLDGPPLSSKLPEATGTAYLATLERYGVSPIVFEHVKPWFATLTLSVLPLRSLGYDPENGADRQIELAAIAANKSLAGLETSEQQIGFFADMPEALQLDLLTQTLDEMPEMPDTIGKMIAAWAKGKPDALADLMNESVDQNPELEKRLLTDRNAVWADWIKARLDQPGIVFLAVGAGHLAGDNSVQAMLRQRGIVTRRSR